MNARVQLDRLPDEVAERVRTVSPGTGAGGGRHVLYWMHHAVRGHENPALDAAISAAAGLDLPLLVYQGLGAGHRFDNDRHHTFILEGARDARAELSRRGLIHVLRLPTGREQASPLAVLCADAALVVTEDFPVPPFPRWTARLAASTAAPVWAVDTACVVPMRLVGAQHDRAFRFRDTTRDLLAERLHRPWNEVDSVPRPFDRSSLPFEDVDLATADITELVADCRIDHTIGPVAHTPGGSVAGYERWRKFREAGLTGYSARRNDPTAAGVSRLSAYLHHGHVSPFRIAREAAAVGGKGAEKFLDELIVWRELAHNLCFHRHREIESLEVLPAWAQSTLEAHAGDPRQVLSWETLARGRTGDRFWDLCQASLVRHGELHNNVRMTWGKALASWAETPARALELLIDLNHRFALDGSDPNSYGGLLWCLGLFDRPFAPEQPVLGSIRPRATAAHARRLDLDRYAGQVLAPATERPLEVAVLGAGLSGLACARALADHGHLVRVFDKARGVGGRMATRRAEHRRFDHGAQYFTVRDERFGRFVSSWRGCGVVAPWKGEIVALEGGERLSKGRTERFVGVPGMNAICKHLADRFGSHSGDGDHWARAKLGPLVVDREVPGGPGSVRRCRRFRAGASNRESPLRRRPPDLRAGIAGRDGPLLGRHGGVLRRARYRFRRRLRRRLAAELGGAQRFEAGPARDRGVGAARDAAMVAGASGAAARGGGAATSRGLSGSLGSTPERADPSRRPPLALRAPGGAPPGAMPLRP